MAADPILIQLHDELQKLDADIAYAEGRLRVLDNVNSPVAVGLRSNINRAVKQRNDMLNAIRAELQRPSS